MNENQRGIYRTGLVVLVAISLMLCSLSMGIDQGKAGTFLGIPFQTLVPVNATLATPIGQVTPMPTPIPTLGPGQYFREGDLGLPAVSHIEGGNDEFGYGPSATDESLYVMWITDQHGKRYITVSRDSDMLFGYFEEGTDERRKNGFSHYIQEWNDMREDVEAKELEVNKHQVFRTGSHAVAIGIAFVGGIVCAIVSGGACIVAFAGVALVPWGNGAREYNEKIAAQEELDELRDDFEKRTQKVIGKFEQTIYVESNP